MGPSPLPRFPGLPDRLLEQYLCGELSADEAARVEAAARASPDLAHYLETRHREREAFRLRRPFGPLRERLEPPRRRSARELLRWAAAGLVPVLSLGLLLLLPWRGEDGDAERVRVRGGVTARLVVKRNEAVFELAPGVVLRPGDRLRVEVDDAAGGYLYMLGLTERGAVTPLQGFAATGGALRLAPGKRVLPGSMELDAAPEREALYVLLAPHALGDEEVHQWLRQAAHGTTFPPHPAAPGASRYTVVELPKEVAP